jgi:hypothetical protein
MHFILAIVFSLLIFSCQTPVQDNTPPVLDLGLKRVETIVCNNHQVGENGCIFPSGKVSGELKIYSYFSGNMVLVSQNCKIDKKFNYNSKQGEWVAFNLTSLIGDTLTEDCVLSILQNVEVPRQEDLSFPIYPLKGTVTFGTCPVGVLCDFKFAQYRVDFDDLTMNIGADGENEILVRGCNETTPYRANQGCLFIAGVRGEKKYKFYNKVWLYDSRVVAMSEPLVTTKNSKITVQGDKASLYSICNDEYVKGDTCKLKKNGVNYVRFYTSAGRTMVVKLNNGVVEWIK